MRWQWGLRAWRVLTWIHPLHAVGETDGSVFAIIDSYRSGGNRAVLIGTVGVQVVSSPAGVGDDDVGGDEAAPPQRRDGDKRCPQHGDG